MIIGLFLQRLCVRVGRAILRGECVMYKNGLEWIAIHRQ